MAVVVQKFGGTSVATADRIKEAARKAIRAKADGNRVIVVVSARGDTTDDLIAMANEICDAPPAREMDMLLATGEQISIALMAMAVHDLGDRALSFTGPQIGIVTDSTHAKARIKKIDTTKIRDALDAGNIVIVAGFQGMDERYNITTLGRGGSDTTAVALAAAMKLDPAVRAADTQVRCEIYTDVDGVYTTDPRIVPDARKTDSISYDEMLEMASMGAGVMHSRSIEFAKKFDVPLMVRNSFSDAVGTWILPEAAWMAEVPVCGAALARDEARIVLDGVPDRPGVSHRVFSAVAAANIPIDMIAQSAGEAGKATIGFTVLRTDLADALAVLQPVATELGAVLRGIEDVSKVSVVGAGMRYVTGVAETAFAAIAAEGINIKMISTGDIKISILVDKNDGVKALKALHAAFALHEPRKGAGISPGDDPVAMSFQSRPPLLVDDRPPDLSVLAAKLIRHGGHSGQRGGPDAGPLPGDRVRPAGPTRGVYDGVQRGRLGRRDRRHDRPEPDRPRPGRVVIYRPPGRPGESPRLHPPGGRRDRPGLSGGRHRGQRGPARSRRRDADAHRRCPGHVRGVSSAGDQYPDD